MKIIITFLSILISAITVSGQQKYLTLDNSCKSKLPPISPIKTIDNRAENQILGFIETGISNRLTEIKYDGNLVDSLAIFFGHIRENSNIILMLNEFNLWEFKDRDGQFGRFKLSVRLFKPVEDDKYEEFMTYDSIHSVQGQIDVTNKLIRSVNNNLCEIADLAEKKINSQSSVNNIQYSIAQLMVLDSIEKVSIPIYQHNVKPESGIYAKYSDFKINIPSKKVELIIDDYNPDRVKVFWINEKGKKRQLLSTNIYAISDGSRIFKSLSMGFFEIVKENNDFYYVRPSSVGNSGMVFIPIGSFGLIGAMAGGALYGVINSYTFNQRSQLLLYKINHRRGSAIPLSKVTKK